MTVAAESVAMDQRQARVRALTSYDPHNLTLEQVKLIKDTVARGASDEELRLFIAVCGQTGLNPFTRQIHFVKRWDSQLGREVGTFQTGIDGYRLIAQRTGQYGGQTETKWCGADGVWSEVWLKDEPPAAAKVGVYRRGIEKALWGVARWKAYHQTRKDGTPNAMWQRYDAEQLAKCAEALALRKAFPQELAGIYAHEELSTATAGVPYVTPAGGVTVEDLGAGEPESLAPDAGQAAPAVEQNRTPPPPSLPRPRRAKAPVPVEAPPVSVAQHQADEMARAMSEQVDAFAIAQVQPADIPGGSDYEQFFALLVQMDKATPGRDYVKEAPKGSGRYYLVDAEAAKDLGVQGGTKVADNGDLELAIAGRLTAWLRARL